jgi:hypothetical protein
VLTGSPYAWLIPSSGAPAITAASMVITRGTDAAYYQCGDYEKRHTCANSLGVREDLVRKRIFEALRERLSTRTRWSTSASVSPNCVVQE